MIASLIAYGISAFCLFMSASFFGSVWMGANTKSGAFLTTGILLGLGSAGLAYVAALVAGLS